MAKNRGKTVSFDVMVKFFLKQYGIPTRKDFDRIITRLDRLEKLVKRSGRAGGAFGRASTGVGRGKRDEKPATEIVLTIVRRYRKGISFADLQKQSGFPEKKLRNLIYRLDKAGWIQRISRGVYIATNQ